MPSGELRPGFLFVKADTRIAKSAPAVFVDALPRDGCHRPCGKFAVAVFAEDVSVYITGIDAAFFAEYIAEAGGIQDST